MVDCSTRDIKAFCDQSLVELQAVPFRASPEAARQALLVARDRCSTTALLPHQNSPICHAGTTSIPTYSHQHPANLHHPHCIRGEVETVSSPVDCRTTYCLRFVSPPPGDPPPEVLMK